MFLPDVNVWLALTFESHYHHASAKEWFDEMGREQVAFCRLSQQGYLRLATNPSAFSEEAVTMAEAWNLYDQLLADERVFFINEVEGVEAVWRKYTWKQTFSPRIWNDAYLAALAAVAHLKVVTFDRAFRTLTKTHSLILS